MAVTTDPFTNADEIALISETWTTIVNEKLFDKTVFANFCQNLSSFATEGSDIFHVPDIFTNALTVSTQSTQGAEITTASPLSVDTTLTIDTHKYVAYLMGDLTLQQVAKKYDVLSLYADEAASLLAEALEASIAGLWSSITTNTIGDTATVLSDAEVRRSIEKLASAKFNLDECAFFVHPYVFWIQLHAVAKYYTASIAGPMNEVGAVRTGNFGSATASRNLRGHLYGIPLYTSTNVVSGLQTYRNLLLHKSAFGFAVQTRGGNKVRVQMDNLIQNLGTLTVADIIYGVKILREPGSVLVNASSTFIGS